MPVYSSRCEHCGTAHEYVRKMADCYDTPVCCDLPTTKTLDRPMIAATFGATKGAFMHKTGEYVEGTQMKQYLAKHKLISEAEGMREADIQRANQSAENDTARRKAAEDAVRQHLG